MLPMGVTGNIWLTTWTVTAGMALGCVVESARPSADKVRGPAMPSGNSPSLFWNAITAATVPCPYWPSMAPGLKPCVARACCNVFTSSLLSPCFNGPVIMTVSSARLPFLGMKKEGMLREKGREA
jgi:hypothetical protein